MKSVNISFQLKYDSGKHHNRQATIQLFIVVSTAQK